MSKNEETVASTSYKITHNNIRKYYFIRFSLYYGNKSSQKEKEKISKSQIKAKMEEN